MILLDHEFVDGNCLTTDLARILGILRNEQVSDDNLVLEHPAVGGYANKNFIISTKDKPDQRLFVRLANPRMEFYLRHRKRDYQFYDEQRLSARIHCLFGNGCIMEVLDGTPLVIQADSRLYDADIQSDQLPLPTAEETLKELDYLTAILDQRNSPMAFCHGDLNPTNIVYNSGSKRAMFVDYDSPSITHAVFDIAMHFFTFCDVFNVRRPLPSEEYRRKWLFHYLTKKNELNGICTFAPVSDSEIDKYMDDLKVANLKAILQMMSVCSWIVNDLSNPGKSLDPNWLVGVVRDHWAYYNEQKRLLHNILCC